MKILALLRNLLRALVGPAPAHNPYLEECVRVVETIDKHHGQGWCARLARSLEEQHGQ